MNKVINLERILIYYDIIHLFIGSDPIGCHYLCMLYDDIDFRYVGIRISNTNLARLLSGLIDLRSIFIESECPNEYFILDEADDDYYCIIEEISDINEDMLPEDELFLTKEIDDPCIIEERIKKNKPIIHLGVQDEQNSHNIQASSLSKILNCYQDFITNTHKKLHNKKALNKSEYNLIVFNTSAASFNVHMYIDSTINLFGDSDIDATLVFADKIFDCPNEELLDELRKVKGNVLSSYKRLLFELVENNLSLKYKWTTPNIDTPVISKVISKEKIKTLYDTIIESTIEPEQEKIIIGYFLKVDCVRKSWIFYDASKETELKGKCDNSDLLSGITVRTIDYRINCKITIEKEAITDKEKESITLIDINQIDN